MKRIILILCVLFLYPNLVKSQNYINNSYAATTLTFDTTATVQYGILNISNFGGGFNIAGLIDSLGVGSSSVSKDSLQLWYKMMYWDAPNNQLVLLHDDWKAAEFYSGTAWTELLTWTDSTKYTMDLPDLDVCDACSLKVSVGNGDEFIGTFLLEAMYFKR